MDVSMNTPNPPATRKNPVLPTRLATLPPASRGRVALGMTSAAARGHFALQRCADCATVQYPAREVCQRCLSVRLVWTVQDGAARLLSETTLQHSNDLYFRQRLPRRLGLAQLDAGPTVVVHLLAQVPAAPSRLRVGARLDRSGQAVLIGWPETEMNPMQDDPLMREMTCDPRSRKVLVTDGKTEVGQEMVRALVHAGAELVWVGQAEPWKRMPGTQSLAELPQVTVVPLDLTSGKSVAELAGEIAGKVDIVVNNAELHRTHGITTRSGTDAARAEMDINYFGLLRLAQAFAPALAARGADGAHHAVAWVNLLSIYALSNFPAHGTYSASKAAALSLSQCLRAELRPAGIRVVNLFPGPIDDDWNQLVAPPKVSAAALATALVQALRQGQEDVYPGDVAQEWLARWREDPKVLERELSGVGP